jgi:hypothetical protein
MKSSHPKTPAFVLALALLSACGGGGGGGSQVSLTTVTGTVVANAALADYRVTVNAQVADLPGTPIPNDFGAYQAFGTAGSDGRYSATSHLGDHRPLLIAATSGLLPSDARYPLLHSVSFGATTNVTPLTSLLTARLLNRIPEFSLDGHAVTELQNRSVADFSAARDQIVAYLLTRPNKLDGTLTSPVDVSAVTDFVSMAVTPVAGDPHFDALKRFHDSLMDRETIRGVQEHMLYGKDGPADLLTMLTLDFDANCTGTGASGAQRVVLDRHGLTVGSVDLPFQTGDEVVIDTASRNWIFVIKGSQASLEIGILQGALFTFGVSLPSGGFGCNPKNSVSLSGKYPSRFGLTSLLSQSTKLFAGIQCPAPITFPGFLDVTSNMLFFHPNGAVGVNGFGGPAVVHPASLNIVAHASLTVTAGQVDPVRLTSFRASRNFNDGSDDLEVTLTAAGDIAGLRLSRSTSQFSYTQTCGTL